MTILLDENGRALDVRFQRLTRSERILVRESLLAGKGTIEVFDNEDGTWAADVRGFILEAGSCADALREIAAIVEEA